MAITKVSNSVLKESSVHTHNIADNSVNSDKLNVTGNGTSGQALLSDGDGTFSWGPAGESYTAGIGLSLTGNEFSNTNTLADLGYTGATNANYITNNNELTNGAGYIASYTETDTLDTVTGRGAITSNTVQFGEVRSTGDVIAYYSSDKRLKDDIKPIENALAKIDSIGGYTFDWNDNQSTYEGSDIGVIAQEIEAIAPELVIDRETGYKAVKYEKLVAILIEGIKELSAKVKELENKL